jgi:hypothetical protein
MEETRSENLIDEKEPDSLLVTDAVWEAIRHHFTEEEKKALRDAIGGETICPKGIVINRDKLTGSLSARITDAKRKLVTGRTNKGGTHIHTDVTRK